jgi:hypothetical protein
MCPTKHDQVNHFENEYVRYEDGLCITTNGTEGFFANLMRWINGVYHHVGQQHFHRYLPEFDPRPNTRKETDSKGPHKLWRARPEKVDAAGFKTAELKGTGPNFKERKTAKGPLAGGPHR